MRSSDEVLAVAGGSWEGGLNQYVHGGRRVITLQVDESVFAVGDDGYRVSEHTLSEWLGQVIRKSGALVVECPNAAGVWAELEGDREDCFVWQCGGCDAWIFTSNCPVVGVLECSTCGDGGVDFCHAS